MKRILAVLGSGLVFKRVYGIILRIAAVFTVLGGAGLWISTWQEISNLQKYRYHYSGVGGIIPAGVVVQILMVILIYCVVHTLWIRAKTVEQLPETGYVIAPIFSVTLKLVGEVLASVLVFSGFAGGLSMWIARRDVLRLLGLGGLDLYGTSSLGAASFVTGLLTILLGLFFAFISLVVFYYSAELAVVLVDIAGNTRMLNRRQNSNEEQETAASKSP